MKRAQPARHRRARVALHRDEIVASVAVRGRRRVERECGAGDGRRAAPFTYDAVCLAFCLAFCRFFFALALARACARASSPSCPAPSGAVARAAMLSARAAIL